jgi:hypothetical protein
MLRRIACVRGDIEQCETVSLALPTTRAPSSDETGPYPDYREHISALRKNSIDPRFPTILMASSTCVGYLNAVPSFTMRPALGGDGTPLTRPTFTGDILFIDATRNDTSFYRSFEDAGIRYVLGNPLTFYMCPNLADDTGRFYTAVAVREHALRSPLSEYATTTDDVQQLEERLSRMFMREDDALRYLLETRSRIEEGTLDRGKVLELTDLLLAARYNSAGFEHTAFLATAMQDHTAVAPDVTYLQIPYLFFARSGFLTLFLGWNPSVVGDDLNPLPSVPLHTLGPNPYVLYSSLPPAERAVAERALIEYYRTHGLSP